MSVIITDLGNTIEFDFSNVAKSVTSVYTLTKLDLRVKQDHLGVHITNADGFIQTADNKVITVKASEVTSPIYVDDDALYAGIIAMGATVSLGGGGASAGGGSSVWSTKQGDFSAVTTDSTKNITVTGLPWTLEAQNVAIVELFSSSGDKSTLATTNVVVSGGVITLGDIDDFEPGDTVAVTLIGPDKAYDDGGDQGMNFITNQDSEKWTSPEHLIDLAVDAATNRYVIPMEGYKDLSTHRKITAGGTVTISLWGTNNADADDSADTDWVDITADYFTKAVTGTTEVAEVSENIFFLKLMIKVVATGTTNLIDVYIKKKSL